MDGTQRTCVGSGMVGRVVPPKQRKENIRGPRGQGRRPAQATGKWPLGLVQEEKRGVPEVSITAGAWGPIGC